MMKLALGIILIATIYIVDNAMDFRPEKIETGIMFQKIAKVNTAYVNWNLCYYYDLDEYFKLREKLGNCIHKMQTVCESITEKTLCNTLLEQLSSHSALMVQNEEMIESYEHTFDRKKRALFEIIGRIYNAAFGLLDADDGRRYDQQIEMLKTNTLTNKDLIKDHTTILEANMHLHNETFQALRMAIQNLTIETNRLEASQNNVTRDIQYQSYFNTLATISTLIISQQEKASRSIMTVLQNTIKGTIIDLVPIAMLEDDLRSIETYLEEDERLPIHLDNENIHHLFKVITAKSNMIGRKMIMEISIPIITTEIFQLIKPIPIPSKNGNIMFTIQPQYPYFLLDIEHMRYVPLEEEELGNCKIRTSLDLICSPYSPIYKKWESVCEMNLLYKQNIENLFQVCDVKLLPNTNYIVPINRKNEYYCTVTKEFHVNNICGKTFQNTEYITEDGILTVRTGCIIRTEIFDIKPHTEKYMNKTTIIKPLTSPKQITETILNEYEKRLMTNVNTNVTHGLVLINDYKTDYDHLQNLIEKAKERDDKNVTYSNIDRIQDKSNYNIIISIIIIIILVVGIMTTWKMMKNKIKPITTALAITINEKQEKGRPSSENQNE